MPVTIARLRKCYNHVTFLMPVLIALIQPLNWCEHGTTKPKCDVERPSRVYRFLALRGIFSSPTRIRDFAHHGFFGNGFALGRWGVFSFFIQPAFSSGVEYPRSLWSGFRPEPVSSSPLIVQPSRSGRAVERNRLLGRRTRTW